VIASGPTLGRLVGWLGLGIGLAVAVAGSAGYLLVAWSELGNDLSLLSEIKAARLAKYIYLHQELWQYHTLRLSELIEVPEAKGLIVRQRLVDAAGTLVLETGDALASPSLRQSASIRVAGAQVATIETATSLRPLLTKTGLVTALSCLLGLAVYLVIRTLPLRIIDRTVVQLEATQARLLATIEAIPIEFMEFDRDGRLVLINSAARASQGWDAKAVGKTLSELLQSNLRRLRAAQPDLDWDAWMTKRLATLRQTGSFELTRPTGVTGQFFVTDMPGGGQVILRVDITERKQREAELAATQARYRLLFEANPLPMAVIAIETDRFIAINDAALTQYGWSREEFLGMTSAELYLPEDVPALLAARNRKDARGAIRTVRGLRHRRKDGSVIAVEMTARPFRLDGVPALLVMAQDVTERDRAEKERLSAEEQLRQSQKMEAVGQLTTGIAHDFNNILMVILSNTDELVEEVDPALVIRLDRISAAVLRASELTKQLLAFSRKQALSPRATNLNDLVTATGKLLQRSLGAQIEIEAVLAEDLWTINIDPTQLETALVNLAVNARDAMPGGGKLLIETRNVAWGAANGALPAGMDAGDYAMLRVTDTGTGMPPEIQAKVFEPFFTTKGFGKGTGLGLSMVYGFIRQSNGHISIDSAVGRGTTFTIYLPRENGMEQAAAPKRPSLPRGMERVLVVEDEPQVRASIVQQLQSLGYIVSEAADGAAGMVACKAASQPFDLLLTDVMMPGELTGSGLADQVAARWPMTTIAFMSGFPADIIVKDGVLDADVHLLTKPFRKADLAHFVRGVLDGPSS
jgi:PAS domain S-box-containing protein